MHHEIQYRKVYQIQYRKVYLMSEIISARNLQSSPENQAVQMRRTKICLKALEAEDEARRRKERKGRKRKEKGKEETNEEGKEGGRRQGLLN